MKAIIIGGVAGGASAAARLRRLHEDAEIIIFEKGDYVSFANCGLPYFIGGTITDKDKLTLQTPQSFKRRFNIDVRVNSEVVTIDTVNQSITVKSTDGEYQESYDKLLLSPGAKPILPEIDGINSDKILTLRNIPDTYKIHNFIGTNAPQTAVVVGGGFIGMEMAENLVNNGIQVTLIDKSDHLIPSIDYDMACSVHNHIREKGVHLMLSSEITSISEDNNQLILNTTQGVIYTDMLIMAVGVHPDTAFIKGTNIAINDKGYIIVDKYMQTSVKDVYAVGDAVEINHYITDNPATIPLAGPANKQGRIAADNIVGLNSTYDGSMGSSILKVFDLTVASTGINESTANTLGLDYDKTYTYSASHAGYYPGGKNMSIKLLWEKDSHKILGAQIVGYDGVDKRMDVIATAIHFHGTIDDLTKLELCYAPPYSSAKDPVNMAGFVAENVTTVKVKQFFWPDVASLPRDGSVTLLDVRSVKEHEKGSIDGFINISVDELRANLNSIPKDKPVYVHCHSGLRSYIACRILSSNGYDCYNLAGGWQLYSSIINEQKVKDYPCYTK